MFAIMTTVRCARSEVGLSRLPVTEEIAGSNPVERATMIRSWLECFLFISEGKIPHMPTIYSICGIEFYLFIALSGT